MFVFWLLLSATIVVEGIATLVGALRFRRFFRKLLFERFVEPVELPRVALLAPCKGIDENLQRNIESWRNQEYKSYKIFFVVESEDDPVVSILRGIPGTELLIAGAAKDCGQKIHNLRYAIDRISKEYEVLAFIDSDCMVRKEWLTALIHQLIRDPDGAVTGYRWFLPATIARGSILRAVWNSSILTMFEPSGRKNFAWGGSMAIFRRTFELAGVTGYWAGSVSDDYGLTNALRAKGRRIHFVPGAMAFADDSISAGEFLKWSTRQLIITRIYFPGLWWKAFVFHMAWVLWFVKGIFYGKWFFLLFLLVQSFQMIKASIRLSCVESVLHARRAGSRFWYWILSPVMAFLNCWILLCSLSSKIEWRGIRYVLEGPYRLRVERTDSLPNSRSDLLS